MNTNSLGFERRARGDSFHQKDTPKSVDQLKLSKVTSVNPTLEIVSQSPPPTLKDRVSHRGSENASLIALSPRRPSFDNDMPRIEDPYKRVKIHNGQSPLKKIESQGLHPTLKDRLSHEGSENAISNASEAASIQTPKFVTDENVINAILSRRPASDIMDMLNRHEFLSNDINQILIQNYFHQEAGTVLHFAARANNFSLMKYLLDSTEINANMKDFKNHVPLHDLIKSIKSMPLTELQSNANLIKKVGISLICKTDNLSSDSDPNKTVLDELVEEYLLTTSPKKEYVLKPCIEVFLLALNGSKRLPSIPNLSSIGPIEDVERFNKKLEVLRDMFFFAPLDSFCLDYEKVRENETIDEPGFIERLQGIEELVLKSSKNTMERIKLKLMAIKPSHEGLKDEIKHVIRSLNQEISLR